MSYFFYLTWERVFVALEDSLLPRSGYDSSKVISSSQSHANHCSQGHDPVRPEPIAPYSRWLSRHHLRKNICATVIHFRPGKFLQQNNCLLLCHCPIIQEYEWVCTARWKVTDSSSIVRRKLPSSVDRPLFMSILWQLVDTWMERLYIFGGDIWTNNVIFLGVAILNCFR